MRKPIGLTAPYREEDDDIQDYKKPWVGLTDAEVFELFRYEGTADSNVNPHKLLADARRIEAKLKEKNT